MFKKTLLATVILASTTGAAFAASPSYNFIEGGYQRVDDFHESDGFELNGMIDLNETFFLQGGYTNLEGSKYGEKLEGDLFNIGLGVRAPIADNVDFNASIDYLNGEADAYSPLEGHYSYDDDGYRLGVGVRAQVTAPLELAASYTYDQYSDDDDLDTKSVNLKATYTVADNVGLYAGYSVGLSDTADAWSVGARLNF